MSQLAHSALTAVIFTSAAGALVMCLLVFRYGFAPDPDELPSAARRRFFITRLGHALAGTCFAATAILAVIALVDLSRSAPPAVGPDDRLASQERLASLTSRVKAAEARLQGADELVRRLDARLQTMSDDVRNASPRRDEAARPRVAAPLPAPPRSTIVEPRVVNPAPPTPVGPTVRPDVALPPASAERRVAVPAPKSREPEMRPDAPQPSGFSEPRAVSPAAPTPVKSALPKGPPPDDLVSRLRRDWDSVKRGFATAGREFRAAVDEQARTVRGEGK